VFRKAQTELEMAFEGLGNSISEKVSPALSSLMTAMANWVGTNREMLSLSVTKWANDYGAAVGAIGTAVDKAVTGTVGWSNAIEYGLPLLAARAIPVLARLENAMLRLALVRAPSWLASILGGPVGLALGTIGAVMAPSTTNTGEDEFLRQHRGPDGQLHEGPVSSPATMNPTMRGFLDTLAGPESGGAYDIKNGGSHFSGYGSFPEGVGPGGTSTAAGRYQFLSGTWRDEANTLGLKDFSPGNQDQAAWHLANTTYRSKTGRDLDDDLKAGNRQSQIATALGPIWPSLPGGSQSHQSQDTFNRSLAENTAKVDVHVRFSGAPPGTTATATSNGSAVGGVRVEHSMAPS
jgi:muramidase (phage lysozyme)